MMSGVAIIGGVLVALAIGFLAISVGAFFAAWKRR
jgi:hypothetical protein